MADVLNSSDGAMCNRSKVGVCMAVEHTLLCVCVCVCSHTFHCDEMMMVIVWLTACNVTTAL